MVGMRGMIRMRGIMTGMQGIRVEMRVIRVGMQRKAVGIAPFFEQHLWRAATGHLLHHKKQGKQRYID